MPSKALHIVTICLIGASLASCSKHLRPDFGEAVTNNKAEQQQFADTPAEGVTHELDGRKAERVIDNYRSEKSKADSQRLVNDMSN